MTFPAFAPALDRRLRPDATAPIAVGFSGGSDSLALLMIALDWARARGRQVLSLTVDHGLQAGSAAGTAQAVDKARGLGAEARGLAWTGDKPAAGLPAVARRARHALLARAAREAGARVLLLGHTADDLAEAAAMRAAGSTVPDPREWSPSPVWPEGRDVFLLRPLLGQRRANLRGWLRVQAQDWLDDPANDDLRYARARARSGLASGEADEGAPRPLAITMPGWFEGNGRGWLSLPRAASLAQLAAACLCVSGAERPPRGARVEALAARLRAPGPVTATLAGARIETGEDPGAVQIFREAGEAARGGLAPLALAAGQSGIWDGRYEIFAGSAPVSVQRLRGQARRLPPEQRAALAALPTAARGALPVLVSEGGEAFCPMLDGPGLATPTGAFARAIFLDRFMAACGLIDQEPAT